MQANISFSDRN